MPRFPLALLVALLAVVAGCTSNSSAQPSGDQASQAETAEHPTPEIRSDGAFVYLLGGIEYPFPSVLTFDDGAWVREGIVWIDGTLLGHQYAHTQRPRKMLYNITHSPDGYEVRFQEGKRNDEGWLADGKGRVELPDGAFQEFSYIEGIENGMWKSYGADGHLILECMMVNDERHGKFATYRSDGSIESSGIMEHGEAAIITMHNELGQPIAIKDMKTGETATNQ